MADQELKTCRMCGAILLKDGRCGCSETRARPDVWQRIRALEEEIAGLERKLAAKRTELAQLRGEA
jgi:predicted  nucleic acid-binding Zn-ribbon protein